MRAYKKKVNHMEKKRSFSKTLIVVWICFGLGLITAMWIASWLVSGVEAEKKYVPGQEFYQIGDIYEFSSGHVEKARDITKEGRARWTFRNPFYKETSSYLLFYIEGEAIAGQDVLIRLQNKEKKDIQRIVQVGQEGWNIVFIQNEEVRRFRIVLNLQSPDDAEIIKAKVLQQEPQNEKVLLFYTILMALIYFVGYTLLAGICAHFGKNEKKFTWHELLVACLQRLYCCVDAFGERFIKLFGKGVARMIRLTSVFLILYLPWSAQQDGSFYDADDYRALMLICSILMVLAGIFCWEKKLRFVKWDHWIAKFYFITAICLTLSDLIVHKNCGGLGFILLFVMPFVFFMWQNMERPALFLIDLAVAVLLFLLVKQILLYFGDVEVEPAVTGMIQYQWEDHLTILKEYFRSLSPWGHSGALVCFGKKQNISGGFLRILYNYGMFAFLPYVILRVSIVKTAFVTIFRGIKKQEAAWGMWIGIAELAVLAGSMWVDFELPYASELWLLFYLLLGWMFLSEKDYSSDRWKKQESN